MFIKSIASSLNKITDDSFKMLVGLIKLRYNIWIFASQKLSLD